MDEERGNSPENKSNSSLVWFSLIIVVTIAVVLFVFFEVFNLNGTKMSSGDFVSLLKATRYTDRSSSELVDGFSGALEYKESGKNGRRVRFSNIHKIKVRDRQITGSVDFQVLDGSGKSDDATTRFVTITQIKSDLGLQELKGLLLEANVDWEEAGPTFLDRYGSMIFMVGLITLLFLFVFRRLGGAGGPMQFGRSRGRLYADEELNITFNDVAGIDEAVEEVKEVVDFLQTPEKYQKLGGRIPRGVLLVGPPGTGKTLLAKAIAGEAGVPFFSLSGSDFVEMFVGVGAARVRDLFQQAEAKSPCIIFIDELDALGKTRSANAVSGQDEREQTLNALLVEMDGFASNSGVIVMAATNRPETLDQALMRPGRFDRNVLVDRPDIRGREDILKVHVKSVKLDPLVDLQKVASISPGFAGADLANLVNEAALMAARKEKSSVGMDDFNESVERVTAGLEKKQRVMNGDEKERVAYHESGHALVACCLPNTDPVHKVSIIPRGIAALGYTMQRPTSERYLMTQSELESQLQILLAGTIAEEIVYKDISTGAQNDLERCTDIARNMVTQYGMSRLGRVNFKQDRSSPFLAGASSDFGSRTYSETTAKAIDEEVSSIIENAIDGVRNILESRYNALVAVTKRLIEVEAIDGEELKLIIDENTDGPVVVPGTTTPTLPGQHASNIPDEVDRSDDGERSAQ